MAQDQNAADSALEIDRLATQLAKDPHSRAFMPLAEEYGKVGMWQEAVGVLEDGLKLYPNFIIAMVALGRAYDHMGQTTKAKVILEESVKLSPENLRAHRTLIKIYQSQGLNESALQSCAVILAVNPRDEEALSVQAALGGPLKHKKELERPKLMTPITSDLFAPQTVVLPAPGELTASTPAMRTIQDVSISTPTEPKVVFTDPLVVETRSIEIASLKHVQTRKQLTGLKLDPQVKETIVVPPPTPHADVVMQLESWLYRIESRRHDGEIANESRPQAS
ncbi:MAG: tetratricopeptide repeat protein [Nitrospirota bacterium]